VQCEMDRKPEQVFESLPKRALVCINTHDMSPLAGFVLGQDIELRREYGLISAEKAQSQSAQRRVVIDKWINLDRINSAEETFESNLQKAKKVHSHIIKRLKQKNTPLLAINMEDLWGEVTSQNLPGLSQEYPNWRHRYPEDYLSKCQKEIERLGEVKQRMSLN